MPAPTIVFTKLDTAPAALLFPGGYRSSLSVAAFPDPDPPPPARCPPLLLPFSVPTTTADISKSPLPGGAPVTCMLKIVCRCTRFSTHQAGGGGGAASEEKTALGGGADGGCGSSREPLRAANQQSTTAQIPFFADFGLIRENAVREGSPSSCVRSCRCAFSTFSSPQHFASPSSTRGGP